MLKKYERLAFSVEQLLTMVGIPVSGDILSGALLIDMATDYVDRLNVVGLLGLWLESLPSFSFSSITKTYNIDKNEIIQILISVIRN